FDADEIAQAVQFGNLGQLAEYLFNELGKLPQVAELRGLGYLVGIKFTSESARPYQQALLERKIITGLADDASVLRLLPPLTLKRAEIDLFLNELAAMQF